MSTGTECLDSKWRPLIPMCKEAVDAAESLKARSTFSYRLVQVFGLKRAKVMERRRSSAAKIVSISSHSRRDNEERMPTHAPLAYKYFAITRLTDLGSLS